MPATSIPSPPPGKDPPFNNQQTEPFPNLSPPQPDKTSTSNPSPQNKYKGTIPPPQIPAPSANIPPTTPAIITQAPSTSTSLRSTHLHTLYPTTQSTSKSNLISHLGSTIREAGEDTVTSGIERPANFQPFFVLVDDLETKGTSHPNKVHYLFSDDESADLTSSLISCLDVSRQTTRSGQEGGDGVEREERVVIIDINSAGDSVTAVNSLSKEWQVLGARIEEAPIFEGSEKASGGGGLMLRLEGLGVDSLGDGGSGEKAGERRSKGDGKGGFLGEDEMRELLEGFENKMLVLKKLSSLNVGGKASEVGGEAVPVKRRVGGEGNEMGEG